MEEIGQAWEGETVNEALAAKVDPAAFLAIGFYEDKSRDRLVWIDTRDKAELGWVSLALVAEHPQAKHMAFQDVLRTQALRYPFTEAKQ